MKLKKPLQELKLSVPVQETSVANFLTASGTFHDGDLLLNHKGLRLISEENDSSPSETKEIDLQFSLEDLETIKVIGKGSGGVVQLVRHKWVGTLFALKVIQMNIQEDIRKQIVQELKINQASQCSNIVVCYHSFYHNGAISLVFEYMDRGSLADVIRQVKTILEPYLAKFLVWFGFLKNPFSSYATVKSSSSPSSSGGGGSGDGDREQQRRKNYNIMVGSKDELKRVFATFDKNSDGFITKKELRDSLKNIGIVMVEKDIDDMVKNVDTNGDGLIDLDEFCNSFASLFIKEKEEEEKETTGSDGEQVGEGSSDNITTTTISSDGELKEAFDVFDGDKDGLITVEELGFVLSSLGFREGNSLEDCKEMIKKVDVDGDGMVSFHEFQIMMKSGHKTTLVPIF